MENGSILLEQSMISEGVTIPSGETWSGAPASVSESDNDILAMRRFRLKDFTKKDGLRFEWLTWYNGFIRDFIRAYWSNSFCTCNSWPIPFVS